MPPGWKDRPRLSEAEHILFGEFLLFAQFCGGEPRPTDALAWFELRDVPRSERAWMAHIFSAMSAPLRERGEGAS